MHPQAWTVPAEEPDDREPDGIRALRRTSREDAMGSIVGWRIRDEFRTGCTIEDPENDQVREAFDVGQPRLQLRANVEHADGIVVRSQPLGD